MGCPPEVRDEARAAGARWAVRALIAVTALAVLAPAPAGAIETEQFGVEPFPLFHEGTPRRGFELALAPGEAATEQVRVWNKTRRPLTLLVYGAGVEVTEQGHDVAAYEDRDRGAGGWVRPSLEQVALGPGEAQVVELSVVAPAVMPDRERFAALVVEGDTGVDAEGVDVYARLALLVEVRREGPILWGLSWLFVLAVALLGAVVAAHLVRARAGGVRGPERLSRGRGARRGRPPAS